MTIAPTINPEDYESDHRVTFLVAEWKRLSQAEKDAIELSEVDPGMKDLVEKELTDIEAQKSALTTQMQSIIGDPNEREWPDEVVLEVRAGVGGEEASLFAEELAGVAVTALMQIASLLTVVWLAALFPMSSSTPAAVSPHPRCRR